MNPIFSEDFYDKPLFKNGERAYIKDGTVVVGAKESKWKHLKRFMTFEQDPDIIKVHDHLKVIAEQIDSKTGPYFQDLTGDVHHHGEIKFKCLESNLTALRAKLDNVGQVNSLSKFILKAVNLFRHIFQKPAIEVKSFAKIEIDNPRWFWMMTQHTKRSFELPLKNLKESGLKLTSEDKKSCVFSADEEVKAEKFQALEKGLESSWSLKTSYIRLQHQVYSNTPDLIGRLEIFFDAEQKQFFVAIRNPFTNRLLNKDAKKILDAATPEQKTIKFTMTSKNDQQSTQNHELVWKIDDLTHLTKGSTPFPLTPNVEYQFFDKSQNLIEKFTLRSNPFPS